MRRACVPVCVCVSAAVASLIYRYFNLICARVQNDINFILIKSVIHNYRFIWHASPTCRHLINLESQLKPFMLNRPVCEKDKFQERTVERPFSWRHISTESLIEDLSRTPNLHAIQTAGINHGQDQKCRGGKCRTGKRGSKNAGLEYAGPVTRIMSSTSAHA